MIDGWPPFAPGHRRSPPPQSPGGRENALFGLIVFSFFLKALLWGGPAAAAEWSVTPSVSLRESFSDNIRMTPEEHKLVWGSTLSPLLRWGAATERLELHGDLAASLGRYVGESGLNTNDAALKVASQYEWERSRWGLDGNLLWDSTWRSELRETGLILANRRRHSRSIGGFWEEALTERLSLRGEYQRSDIRYAEEGAGLFNYQSETGSVELTDSLSERDRATLGVNLLRYRAPSARIRSVDVALLAGLTHFFSETLSAKASIGGRELLTYESFGPAGRSDRSRGGLGDLTVEKQFEALRWLGGVSRRIDPSGSGYLLQTDHLFTSLAQQMTETVTVSLSVDGYRNRVLRTGLLGSESRAFSVEPAWVWRWTEEWSMSVSYRFAWQRGVGSSPAESNTVAWTLFYGGTKWTGDVEGLSAEQ